MKYEVYCPIAKKVVVISESTDNLYRCSHQSRFCGQQLVLNIEAYCHQEMVGIDPNWINMGEVK